MSVSNDDLIEIERAGRRCSVCRSGRGWRRFHVVRASESDSTVLCGSCHARFGDAPSSTRAAVPDPERAPAQPVPVPSPPPADDERRSEQRPDRLRVALDKMSGPFSTAMVARAAGLKNDKAQARLEELERRGEIRRIGKRWSTESPPSDVEAAMDRLAARTTNLRIVRKPSRVGAEPERVG
jgi:hypothetical protein